MIDVKRGEIWEIDLGTYNIIGSEQSGRRYGVIIQNNVGNKYSTTTIVALITSRDKHKIPTHMDIDLFKPSTIMCEQLKTVDKLRLKKVVKKLTNDELVELERCLKISMGIITNWTTN